MKLKNKGKVYPSSSSPEPDALSVLSLLPAAIFAVATLLSLADREVLAYLISRSMKTTTNPSPFVHDPKRGSSKKPSGGSAAAQAHKPPRFDCECFDCYTSYWFRWDSSPSRELINQAIEAFEDHLANGEKSKSQSNSKKVGRGKRRDKSGRRVDVPVLVPPEPPMPEVTSSGVAESVPSAPDSPERSEEVIGEPPEAEEMEEEAAMVAARNQKGSGRKVAADVWGTIKWRVWGIWNPNV